MTERRHRFIILQHGYLGAVPSTFEALRLVLLTASSPAADGWGDGGMVVELQPFSRSRACADAAALVVIPSSNGGLRSNSGVLTCARRLVNELLLCVRRYFSDDLDSVCGAVDPREPAAVAGAMHGSNSNSVRQAGGGAPHTPGSVVDEPHGEDECGGRRHTDMATLVEAYTADGEEELHEVPWPLYETEGHHSGGGAGAGGGGARSRGSAPTPAASAVGPVTLRLDVVAHSMGGLVVRAALPALTALLARNFPRLRLELGVACLVAAPLVGVAWMPSALKARVGATAGCVVPALADLFLRTPTVLETLTRPRFLAAWRAFRRRVLLAVANDNTVAAYSAALAVTPELRRAFAGCAADAAEDARDPPHSHAEPAATAARGKEEQRGVCGCDDDPPPSAPSGSRDSSFPLVFSSDRAGLRRNGYELRACHGGVPDALWPPGTLPAERAAADRIVDGAGPFVVYGVDFRPLLTLGEDASKGPSSRGVVAAPPPPSRAMLEGGALRRPHRAVICKAPCDDPRAFGFVNEFIVGDLLGFVTGSLE